MNERSKLLWFGREPNDDDYREAKNRGLILEFVNTNDLPDFRHARSAVFWATSPYFESTAIDFENYLVRAIDEGLYLQIVVTNDGQRKDVARVLNAKIKKDDATDRYTVRIDPVESYELPNRALMHNPGPAANGRLEIETVEGIELSAEYRLLLQRAFHNCKSIKLELISGGLSGALTFLVAATLADSNAGPHPMPYFAKLHRASKLRDEIRSFREYAEHHVAWHLRPNFISERCIYNVDYGIIVSSFVQPSQSLWEVALEGNGLQHIRSLFDETLVVLRQESKALESIEAGSVVESLERFCNYSLVHDNRVEVAKDFGGIVHSSVSLWRKLLNLPAQRWKRSAIHGDMHGDNVRVRKGDAIVIDFAHASIGPMGADLASLEVWLSFKIPANFESNREQWRQGIETLYKPEIIDRAFSNEKFELTDGWLQPCLQEIRRLAKNSVYSADEYKKIVAVYLLRHATFPPDVRYCEEDEYRRAFAYWLANRMIVSLAKTEGSRLAVA